MPLHSALLHPLSEVEGLAIAVCRTGDTQLHVGLAYEHNEDSVVFCHLAWHHRLRHDLDPPAQPHWSRSELYWKDVSLHPINRKVVAAWLENLRHDSNRIPYGFDVRPPVFSEDGRYIPQALGKGMTCATFVVEVYRSTSFTLVDEGTWPNRPAEDAHWQAEILARLADGHAGQDHVDALRNDIGCIRIRPEEVASATLQDTLPASFESCRALAVQIKALFVTP